MMKFSNAVTRLVTTGLLVAIAGSAAAQQTYPNKPIRAITPYAAGGSAGILTRQISAKLTESWGQQVIVDTRPGGNSVIGSDALVKAPPDGYTILVVASTHVTAPLLMPAPYDPIKDFAPVSTFAVSEFILVLHPSVPANNLQEFIALAKSKPGQLNFSASDSGSATHIASVYFNYLTGVKTQHIPYKGGGPAIIDLLGGHVQLSFATTPAVTPHILSDKLKAIAITGGARLSALPQVPTFSEAGLPSYDIRTWYGILVPAGTPKAIINKMSTEIARIVALPDTKERLVSLGMDPYILGPDRFAALIKADTEKYVKFFKAANIKIEN